MKMFLPLFASFLALVATPAFAAVDLSLGNLVSLVVMLLIAACVFALLYFLVDFVAQKLPLPAKFANVVQVIIVIAAVVFLIGVLLRFAGLV